MKTCENGHPIENVEGTIIILQSGVQTCQCGNSFVFDSLPVKYNKDISYVDGTIAHHYLLYNSFLCKSCGRLIEGMCCTCEDQKISEDTYEHKKHKLMPLGFTRN